MERNALRGARSALVWGLLLATLALGCGGRNEESLICRDCNVVLVLADTLRADHLGAYGYERPTSPALDRLAEDAALFLQARSQSACTFPSVNSLLTSRHVFRFTGRPERPGIPDDIASLPTLLAGRGYATAAVSASPIVRATPSRHNPVGGFGQGFEHFDESCEWRSAACVTGRATALLDRLPRPFFLYLHYMDPHDPYRPPERFAGRFAGTYEGELDFAGRGDPNPIRKLLREGRHEEIEPAAIEHLADLYDEEILAFDQGLGDLFANLRSRELLGETIVLLASDHGEAFLEHGDIKHCAGVWDSQVRVPLAFWIPGLEGPVRRSSPASNLDIVPTLLDYLGHENGGGAPLALAGRSLRRVIESEAPVDAFSFSAMGPYRAVADGRYKLVQDLEERSLRLFDHRRDPAESEDLSAAERPAFRRLREELRRWSREVEGGSSRREKLEEGRQLEEELRALGYLG